MYTMYTMQGVYEEKVLEQYDVHPMLAVAWEGTWGFSVLSILLVRPHSYTLYYTVLH